MTDDVQVVTAWIPVTQEQLDDAPPPWPVWLEQLYAETPEQRRERRAAYEAERLERICKECGCDPWEHGP